MKKALFLLVSLSVANLGFGYGAYVKNNTGYYACFRVEYLGFKHDYEVVVPPYESRKDGGALLDMSGLTMAWVYRGEGVPTKLDWGEISKWQEVGRLGGDKKDRNNFDYTTNWAQNWGLFMELGPNGEEVFSLKQL